MDLRDSEGEGVRFPNGGAAGEGVGVGDGVTRGERGGEKEEEVEGRSVRATGVWREGVRQRGDLAVTRGAPAVSRGGDGEKVGVAFPEEQDGKGGGVLLS